MSNRIKSLEKAITILNILAEEGEIGVSALSRLLDVTKSSAFNTLDTPKEHNWVEKNEVTQKYRLD